MKKAIPIVVGLAICALIGGAAASSVSTPPGTIKDVMALHKGKDSLLNKVTSGKGSDEEHKQLLEAYEAMAKLKPPQGDEASWKMKNEALIAAAKEVVEKKPGAVDKLKAASNCKGCHSAHKGK
jgi:hypothetical protein